GGPEDAEVAVEQPRLDLDGGGLGQLLGLASAADFLCLTVALMVDEQPPHPIALANLNAHAALRVAVAAESTRCGAWHPGRRQGGQAPGAGESAPRPPRVS